MTFSNPSWVTSGILRILCRLKTSRFLTTRELSLTIQCSNPLQLISTRQIVRRKPSWVVLDNFRHRRYHIYFRLSSSADQQRISGPGTMPQKQPAMKSRIRTSTIDSMEASLPFLIWSLTRQWYVTRNSAWSSLRLTLITREDGKAGSLNEALQVLPNNNAPLQVLRSVLAAPLRPSTMNKHRRERVALS